jgi:ApbE superfamily uncharacterized protein (UPF0280 family)
VHSVDDIESALAWAHRVTGVRGVLVIVDDRMGAVGELRLLPAARRKAGPPGLAAGM